MDQCYKIRAKKDCELFIDLIKTETSKAAGVKPPRRKSGTLNSILCTRQNYRSHGSYQPRILRLLYLR